MTVTTTAPLPEQGLSSHGSSQKMVLLIGGVSATCIKSSCFLQQKYTLLLELILKSHFLKCYLLIRAYEMTWCDINPKETSRSQRSCSQNQDHGTIFWALHKAGSGKASPAPRSRLLAPSLGSDRSTVSQNVLKSETLHIQLFGKLFHKFNSSFRRTCISSTIVSQKQS